jgi:hypothetical protein
METINNKLKVTGSYEIRVYGEDGKLKLFKEFNNSIVTAGKGEITNLIGNVSSPVAFTYLAVGTSSTAVSAGQTALQAEITDSGLARASATVTRTTTTTTNDTLSLSKTFSVSGTKVVEEIGVFNNSSAGTMLGRALTGSISLISGDELVATYKVQFT